MQRATTTGATNMNHLDIETAWAVNDLNAAHNARNDTPEQQAKRDRINAELADLAAKHEAAEATKAAWAAKRNDRLAARSL